MGIDDIVDKAKDIAGDVAENTKEFAGDVKEFTGDAFEAAKEKVGDLKDRFDGDDEPETAPPAEATE